MVLSIILQHSQIFTYWNFKICVEVSLESVFPDIQGYLLVVGSLFLDLELKDFRNLLLWQPIHSISSIIHGLERNRCYRS